MFNRRAFVWYQTGLPEEIVSLLEKDLENEYKDQFKESYIGDGVVVKTTRSSKNCWIPTNHWIYGFIWSYICKANEENFRYDISNIDSETMQYTKYTEGDFYTWHSDDEIKQHRALSRPINSGLGMDVDDHLRFECEYVRKLSFSLLLSDKDDFEGGNLQIRDYRELYFSPRKRGTLIIFDSRVPHRVLKVTKGERKSLVGWVIGPRWR